MKGNDYPTINSLINQLVESLKDECNSSDIQFQVKYAQLKSQRNTSFIKLVNQSNNSILILNDYPSSKYHKINADATQKQYQNIMKNCRKLKQIQKQKYIVKLDLKLGVEKIQKVVGEQNWIASQKQQKINRQINLLIDSKQFRIDLNSIDIASQNAGRIIKQFDQKLISAIKCMRFIQSYLFYPSNYYYFKVSQIYQTSQTIQKQLFLKSFKKQSLDEIDKYIISNLPKNRKTKPKYEIQLVMTEQGIQKIIKLMKKRQQLSIFIGDLLNHFKDLSSSQFKQNQDINQLMSGLKI